MVMEVPVLGTGGAHALRIWIHALVAACHCCLLTVFVS